MRHLLIIFCSIFLVLSCGSSNDPLDEPADQNNPAYVDLNSIPLSKFRCCPEFTDAELEEHAENDETYACKWNDCLSDPRGSVRDDLGNVIGVYCEQYPEEDKVYNLTRCDTCVCANGYSIIGSWQDGIPDWHCQGASVGIGAQGGETSCGSPTCTALCIARGWNTP